MGFNPNMSNKEVADLIFLEYASQKPYMNLDFANVTTTNLEATREYATGGQGAPNRITFDGQRKGTLKIDTQIATMKLFSMLSGADITTSFKHAKRYELTAAEGKLTIPTGDSVVTGTVNVFAATDDCGTEIKVTSVEGNVITLPTENNTGDFIVYAIVNVASGAKSVKFNSKTFPKAFTIYGVTPWKTEDDEIAEMHLTYYKAVPQSTFELAFSNTGIISMSITCDLLADKNDDIYDMSLVDEE